MTTFIDARPRQGVVLTGQWKISHFKTKFLLDGPSSQLGENSASGRTILSTHAQRCHWCSCQCRWYRPDLLHHPDRFQPRPPLPSNKKHVAGRCAGNTRNDAFLGSAATCTFVVLVLACTVLYCALKLTETLTRGGVIPIKWPAPPELGRLRTLLGNVLGIACMLWLCYLSSSPNVSFVINDSTHIRASALTGVMSRPFGEAVSPHGVGG